VILVCAVGTAGASYALALRPAFVAAFALAAALRLTLGRDGRRLLPQRPLQVLGWTVSVVALLWLCQQMVATRGQDALYALMCVMSVWQALVLLWEQRVFSNFLLILFSSVHATGLAFPSPPAPASVVFVLAYLVTLVWTLVVFERAASAERHDGGQGAVQRVRPSPPARFPWAAALRLTTLVLALGVPLGTVLYAAAPRNLGRLLHLAPSPPEEGEAAGDQGAGDIAPGSHAASAPDWTVARTGPGRGAPLGSVAEIKRSLEPWFEVRLQEPDRLPPTVVLRENTQDLYQVRGSWDDTLSGATRPRFHWDLDDGRPDGWIPLSREDDPRRGVSLHIALVQGGNRRLFLQPDSVRVQLLRRGRVLRDYDIRGSENETLRASLELEAGDVLLDRYVPCVTDDAHLEGRRSDSAVAPQTCYLQVPRQVAGPLGRRARVVVGDERDPWRRARRLEAWLRSDAFTYTLRIPPMDKANPLMDFVERTRQGNCEFFATALTLMLRTLGHPARYARGFWGGDRLKERKSVIVRGSNYHAWTEMYLDGIGWVPLNPTPPDRRPADAGTITAARDAARGGGGGEGGSFLGLDPAHWRSFWDQVGAKAHAWILDPLRALFSPRTSFAGVPLLLMLLWLLARGRRRVRLRRVSSCRRGEPPGGAYGQALLLLARRGLRRPSAWTGREFARFVARRVPPAGPAFAGLTRLHEATRYGGRAPARAPGRRLLGELRVGLAAGLPRRRAR
jgi:hypothetical protein